MKILLLILFISMKFSLAEDKGFEMKKLKSILTNDFLEEEFKKKKDIVTEEDKLREQRRLMALRFPQEGDFWNILTEVWLVKNAALLKWDIKTPEYGIEDNVTKLFKAVGIYEQKFKILLVDSPSVPHMYLPMKDQNLYILSVPFLRSLDLTKLEISILILEDFLRSKDKYIEQFVKLDNVEISKGFVSKQKTKDLLDKALTELSSFVYSKGYNFQSQFELTKKMDQILKPTPVYWKIYLDYLKKIDTLTKSGELFKSYNRLYPSPEMQLRWLIPQT